MKASIIIPTLNEEEHIKNTLKQWLTQSHNDIEIIVVDGDSTDNTKNIVNSFSKLNPNVRLIVAKGSGPARARNIGCEESTGDVLFIVDADMDSVNREFVEKAMSKFQDENVVGVYPKTIIAERSLIESTFKYRSENTEKKEWDVHPPILRKDIFVELGGYPDIGMGEDRYFSQKLFHKVMSTSKKLVNEYDSVFHVHRVYTVKEYYKQQLWYGRTFPKFAKISGYGLAKKLSFYFNTFFVSLLFFMFLIPKYPILIINILPLLGGGLYFMLKGLKRKTLRTDTTLYALYLVGGIAKGIGLILYVTGKKDGRSKL